jgi:hypothetical protein
MIGDDENDGERERADAGDECELSSSYERSGRSATPPVDSKPARA